MCCMCTHIPVRSFAAAAIVSRAAMGSAWTRLHSSGTLCVVAVIEVHQLRVDAHSMSVPLKVLGCVVSITDQDPLERLS